MPDISRMTILKKMFDFIRIYLFISFNIKLMQKCRKLIDIKKIKGLVIKMCEE